MSVLASKRTLSPHEFENTYHDIYEQLTHEVNKTPERRKKWLAHPINTILNKVMRNVVLLNETMMQKNKDIDKFCELADKTIDMLQNELPTKLYTYYNIYPKDDGKVARLIEKINYEISLQEGIVSKHNPKYRRARVRIYSRAVIGEAEFLATMRDLLVYTNGKVIHAPNEYDDTISSLLMQTCEEAFFNLYQGNRIIPKNRDEYLIRKAYFDLARKWMNEYDRHLFTQFNVMNYNNDTMEAWSYLQVKEERLIEAVMKSDAKRFGRLK